MFELSFYAGLGLTVLLLLVLHWFPWPSRLPRLWAYAFGCLGIAAGIAVWLGTSGQWRILGGIVAIGCAGGIAVILAYQVDHIVWLIRMGWKADKMAKELMRDGDAE